MGSSIPDSIAQWLNEWQDRIRAADTSGARHLFDDRVIAFGTRANHVRNLDRLERDQWERVWPRTQGFTFLLEEAVCIISSDGLMACVALPWESFVESNGELIRRPGRSSILLGRTSLEDPWLARHTHFSLEVRDGSLVPGKDSR